MSLKCRPAQFRYERLENGCLRQENIGSLNSCPISKRPVCVCKNFFTVTDRTDTKATPLSTMTDRTDTEATPPFTKADRTDTEATSLLCCYI